MCDPVSIARKHLLPLLAEAVNMMRRTPVEVEAMKKQLESIQHMIHEADRKASAEGANLKRDEIKEMVKELKEASFEMEDVLDEYIVCEQQLQSRDPGCIAFNPEEAANFIRPMITRVQLAYKIQRVNTRSREIKEKCQIHDAPETQHSSEEGQGSFTSREHDPIVRNLREEAPLHINEVDVVGFEVPKAELIDWLVTGRKERVVISVVGMGGQGKTTLARKVYESEEVIANFDCHAWITVSQSYSVEGLLRDMLQQFDKENNISSMDRKSLKDEVRSYLRQKRYVVFLDDVWDTKLWDEIEFDIFDNIKGSRIFVTTRIREVALHFKKSSIAKVHDLQLLDEQQSFELLCKKAFKSDFGGFCPDELKSVSYEIVRKCEGLPLAIAVIGGVLSGKAPFEWIDYRKNLFAEIESDPRLDVVAKILRFSYDNLHSNFKSCLLYFGLYPEDHAVKSKRLIRQWIAEGFIKQQNSKTLEKVAEGYLKELIQRSLVQVSSFTIDDKVKSCRVHDMVREMILRKAKDLNFCQYIHEGDQLALCGKSRRISLATTSEASWVSTEGSHIRSLLFFVNEKLPECLGKRILAQCKLLKVLDTENVGVFGEYFSEGCLNLLHLKYLRFRCWHLNSLPESIVKLQNLETLDVRTLGIFRLPRVIHMLRKLRHLLGKYICLDDGIGGLESLQTLNHLEIKSSQVAVIKVLGELRQLRELRLNFWYDVEDEENGLVWHSINKMQDLEILHLSRLFGFHDLHLISPPPRLRKLNLLGKLEKVPEWISMLPSLVKLTLTFSHLADDPLKSLKKLPNLLSLTLEFCYGGESLHFQDRDFQKLKILILQSLESLKSIVIEKGALHSLKEFTLDSIPLLKEVPSGIQHLEKLEVINFKYMAYELENNIDPDGGKDHWIVKHVPRVNIK